MTLAFSLQFSEINWLAVIVAAIATFLIGGVWYAALFAKLWQSLNGYTNEQLMAMKAKRPPPVFFGTMIVCYLVIALAMAVLVTSFNITGAASGALLGLIIWFIVAPVGITAQVASDNPMAAFAIDASYQFVYLIMTGASLAAWR